MFTGLVVKTRLSIGVTVGVREKYGGSTSPVSGSTMLGGWFDLCACPGVTLPETIQYWNVYPSSGIALNVITVPLGYV